MVAVKIMVCLKRIIKRIKNVVIEIFGKIFICETLEKQLQNIRNSKKHTFKLIK